MMDMHFKKLLENMPMIFYVLDNDWIFKMSEGLGLKKLGLEPGQVVGLSAKDMYSAYPDIIKAIEHTFSGENVHVVHQLGDLYLENYLTPIYNSSGQIEGISGATIDITERRLAEIQLDHSHLFLRAILDSVPGMLYMYTADGKLTYWNKNHTRITGYSDEELKEFTLLDWYKDDQGSINAVLQGLEKTATEGFGEAEAYLRRKDGQRIPFHFTACPLKIEGNDYFVGVGLDITARKATEEALLELNQTLEEKVVERTEELTAANEELMAMNEELTAMNEELIETNEKIVRMQAYLIEAEKMAALGSLVAGVAHEINTPVGIGITASSHLVDLAQELIQKNETTQLSNLDILPYIDDLKKASQIIHKNLDRAGRLIQSFKQLSVDQTSEPKRRFNVYEYLEEILVSLSPTLKKTLVKVQTICHDDLFIDGYPGAFAQIITNLVMNALNHAFPNNREGQITIELTSIDAKLHLVFSDNGIGMDSTTLNRIYEPFYSTKRSLGGTGLGLSIVYTLVTQRFNGNIICQSSPNNGTCFTISLDQGGLS